MPRTPSLTPGPDFHDGTSSRTGRRFASGNRVSASRAEYLSIVRRTRLISLTLKERPLRTSDAGCLSRDKPSRHMRAGRIGRGMNPPPQFGQTFSSTSSTQSGQKVHSYVQIRASSDAGGKSRIAGLAIGSKFERHVPRLLRAPGRCKRDTWASFHEFGESVVIGVATENGSNRTLASESVGRGFESTLSLNERGLFQAYLGNTPIRPANDFRWREPVTARFVSNEKTRPARLACSAVALGVAAHLSVGASIPGSLWLSRARLPISRGLQSEASV
jgi:hypothetical protein